MARLQRTADNNIRAASAARATASATVNAAATGPVDLTTTEDTNVGRDEDEGRKQQHPTIIKDRLLSEGLEYVGFNRQRQKNVQHKTNVDRFKACYGLEPTTLVHVFTDVMKRFPKATIKHLSLTLNWLTTYQSYYLLSGIWDLHHDTTKPRLEEVAI